VSNYRGSEQGNPVLPTFTSNEQTVFNQTLLKLTNQIKTEFGLGLEQRHNINGIDVIFLSDNMSRLKVNWDVFEQVVLSIGEFLYLAPNSYLKTQLTAAFKDFNDNKYTGNQLILGVPANPQVCLAAGKTKIIEIPDGKTYQQVCEGGNAYTAAVALKVKGVMQTPRMAMMILTPATIQNKQTFSPQKENYQVNSEQAQASNLFHEWIHLLLRFHGTPQSEGEENFV
jgi:hypothetical protein